MQQSKISSFIDKDGMREGQLTGNKSTMKRLPSSQGTTSSKKKSVWIAPSFDDFAELNDPQVHKSKPPKPLPKSGITSTAVSVKTTGASNELWSLKYTPKTIEDLAVHKKKIADVQGCLQDHFKMRPDKAMILLLTGPTGAGKTATINTVAKDMGCQVQEWSNPENNFESSQAAFIPGESYLRFDSQSRQFEDFLLRANKYQTLQLFGEEKQSKKVILVEEFPNVFFREAGKFHDTLRRYHTRGHCPLVFIISDSTSGDSNERLLFPKDLQAELSVSSISFNPVAITNMTKVLQKIVTAESLQKIFDKARLDELAGSSAGDIRTAINSLQFSGRKAPTRKVSRPQTKGRSRGSKPKGATKKADKDDDLAGRDVSLFLFRALGKILHCKRGEVDSEADVPKLPTHLAHHERKPLTVIPEEVVEKVHLSGEFLTSYLHQNYLDFCANYDDVTAHTSYLSDADFLTTEWAHRSSLGEYASSVAVRGLMHSFNAQPGKSNPGWKPLHKPKWFEVNRKFRDNSIAAKHLFKDLYLGHTSRTLLTQYLPFVCLVNPKLHNQGQVSFLQENVRFSKQSSSHRWQTERLDEKDIAMQDDEETVYREMHSTEGSQSADNLDAVEDEDVVIEDFDDE